MQNDAIDYPLLCSFMLRC